MHSMSILSGGIALIERRMIPPGRPRLCRMSHAGWGKTNVGHKQRRAIPGDG